MVVKESILCSAKPTNTQSLAVLLINGNIYVFLPYSDDLRTHTTYFFAKIKILSIGKFQQLPMVCMMKDGSKIWYNRGDRPEGSRWVGKITLEDWIEFCQIEFEIEEVLYSERAPTPYFQWQ